MDSNPLPRWMLTERMRKEMQRRSARRFIGTRATAALRSILPIALIALLIACALAASYGDTLSGINPLPR